MALFAALICMAGAAQEQRHPLDDLETVYKDENVTFRKMDDHTWVGSGNMMSSETMYIVEGKKKAVLIVDVQRLSRGDLEDAGRLTRLSNPKCRKGLKIAV